MSHAEAPSTPDSGQPGPARRRPAQPAGEVSLLELLAVLRRYMLLLIGCLGIGVGLAVATLAWLEPVYVATAQLLIEPGRGGDEHSLLAPATITADQAALESQLTLLASRSMARQVIEALDLEDEPELRRSLDPRKRLFSSLGIGPAAAETNDPALVVDRLLERLAVDRVGEAHVIAIAFQSTDADSAARIANGVANGYIALRNDEKSSLASGASAWFAQALLQSRAALEQAEADLAAARNSKVSEQAGALSLDNLSLANLRRDIAAAAGERAAREVRLARVREVLGRPGDDLAFEELGGSGVLQNLYALKNQTTRREAELATRFGERHPQIVNVRAERQELERRIQAEQQALLGTVEAEIAAARARESTLLRELETLKSESVQQRASEAEISEREQAVARARAQHDSYLARQRELLDLVETQRPDVRLISEATAPSRPTFPQPAIVFGLFSAASLGTGLLLVFFLEQLDRGFRTQRAAEQGLGQRCIGCLPLVRGGRRATLPVIDLPLDRPCSRFAEALRTLVAELCSEPEGQGGRVVLVTSALPREGKSTTTLTLGRLAAAEGLKVLLIDADLRRPRLASLLDLETPNGLVEILQGEREAEDVLVSDPRSGLALIPGSGRVSQPTRLLGPQAMGVLLEEARRHFDLVLIDSAPIVAVTDARVMAPLCDGILFLVRWNATRRAAAAHALAQLDSVAEKLLGTVLTMADPAIAVPMGALDSRLARRELSKYYAEG